MRLCLPSLLFATTSLIAQQFSPPHFANAEGSSNNVFPFGNTTVPFRYSQIHDSLPAMLVSGMSFRHNAATVTYPAHSVTIDAWVSTATVAAGGMGTAFDNNHGVDKQQVIFNRTYTHPASNPADVPGQFVLDYPFDVPFAFGGGSLCWEVHVTAKTQATSITHDSASASTTTAANPAMVVSRFGAGCLATGASNPMAATAVQSIDWLTGTATMTVNGTNLEPNGITLFCTGLDKTSFSGLPLPAVIPASLGAPSGTCTVYSDILLSSVVVNSATGTGTNAFNFVPLPAYHGLTFYSQIWGIDLPANPFGLVTSNATIHHLVAPFSVPLPLSRMWLSGSLGPTASSTAGLGNGLVTRFY